MSDFYRYLQIQMRAGKGIAYSRLLHFHKTDFHLSSFTLFKSKQKKWRVNYKSYSSSTFHEKSIIQQEKQEERSVGLLYHSLLIHAKWLALQLEVYNAFIALQSSCKQQQNIKSSFQILDFQNFKSIFFGTGKKYRRFQD